MLPYSCLPPGSLVDAPGVLPLASGSILPQAEGASHARRPRLRERAREAIKGGKLPRQAPDRTWGGPGVGAACAVCERPVKKDELEFEIQLAHDGDNRVSTSSTFVSAASRRGNSSATSRACDLDDTG